MGGPPSAALPRRQEHTRLPRPSRTAPACRSPSSSALRSTDRSWKVSFPVGRFPSDTFSLIHQGGRSMNRSGRRSHLTALLTAMLVCIGLLSLSTAPVWAAAGTITEFSIPPAQSNPVGITAAPHGNLWFTTPINEIVRITTNGLVTGFPLPTANSGLFSITPDPDGTLWFTAQ